MLNLNKFSKKFKSPVTGKEVTVYFGDKSFDQVKEYNPKSPARAIRQARTLLRHYKNNSDPLINESNGVPTPKAMVATIWGWHEPVTTSSKKAQVVEYAERLLKKHSK